METRFSLRFISDEYISRYFIKLGIKAPQGLYSADETWVIFEKVIPQNHKCFSTKIRTWRKDKILRYFWRAKPSSYVMHKYIPFHIEVPVNDLKSSEILEALGVDKLYGCIPGFETWDNYERGPNK